MSFRITMDDAAKTITKWALSRENLTEERKDQILKGRVYNTLTTLFNASSVMLTIGVVSAIFLAMSSAFVFLALGLFLRATTEKEIEKYTQPVQAPQPEQPEQLGAWARLRAAFQAEHQTRLLAHALNQTTAAAKGANIFDNVGLPRPEEDFDPDAVLLFDFPLWKNSINIPEVVVQRRAEEGAQSEGTAAASSASSAEQSYASVGVAANRLVNLARGFMPGAASTSQSA